MKTVIASAILALFTSSSMANGFGPISAAQTSGSASVVSGSVAGATSSRNGVAISGASNSTQALASVGASSNSDPYLNAGFYGSIFAGSASVNGDVATSSKSTAFNISGGSATGGAAAGGAASADAAGKGFFSSTGSAGGVIGAVQGSASSDTANAAISGRNGFATVKSDNIAGFKASSNHGVASGNNGFSQSVNNYGDTKVDVYSISNLNGFNIGNAIIVNDNGGIAGASAVGGGSINVYPLPF